MQTPNQTRAAKREALTRAERIQNEINTINGQIALARQHYEEAALAVVEDATDKRAQAEIDGIDAEIAALERRRKPLEAALAKAAALDTVEARAAAAAERAEKFAAMTKASAARLAIAAKLGSHIVQLGNLLKQWQDTGEPIGADAASLFRYGYGETYGAVSFDKQSEAVGKVRKLATGDHGALRSALAQALYDAGLGRIGIVCPDIVTITPPRTLLTIERAAEAAHLKLVEYLGSVGVSAPRAKSAE
jgi:hypothetical protein